MKVGIIGLEGAGKKTLFSLLTGIVTENYGNSKKEIGVVNVPDERVDFLSNMYSSKKKTYSKIEFNLVRSMKPNSEETKKALVEAKLMDMFAIVIRQFSDPNVYHPLNDVNAERDYGVIKDELVLADLMLVETRLNNIEKQTKRKNDPALAKEKEIIEKFKNALENGKFISALELNEEELKIVRSLSFLTIKPIFVIINCDEDKVASSISLPGEVKSINVSAKIEQEIQGLDAAERKEFVESMGLTEAPLDRVIKFAYDYGNLMSFLTTGPDESRAWTIKKGFSAQKAGGTIHSDIEKGFIRAEVVSFNDLKECGSEAEAKKRGLYRLEGKEYVVNDGDIIEFRFNV